MRPADTTFSSRVALPGWLAALRGQLGSGGGEAPPEHLGPVAAIEELRDVASAALHGPGPPQSGADRDSLRNDIKNAFEVLGPALTGQLSSSWKELRKDVGRLPKLLDSADGARVLLGAARAMVEVLGNPDVSRAAWDDTVSAFQDGQAAERCELRLMQLRELTESRGIEWAPFGLSSRLEGIINDDPFRLPGVDTEALDPQNFEDRLAGLSQDKRLAIAREVVGEPAATGDVIVWLAFQHAWLDGSSRRLGPVEFFAHQLWPISVREGNYPGGTRGAGPPELHDEDWERSFAGLPDDNFVLARVQLGRGHLAGATERARELVLDIVRVALPDSSWQLMDGTATYLHGRGWGFGHFDDPEKFERAKRQPPSRFEPTSHELAYVDERLVQALAREDHAALDAIGYVRWNQAVDAIPDLAQRIALSIRLLERALPRDAEDQDGSWRGAARRYLQDNWCERQLLLWLEDATLSMLSVHPGRFAGSGSESGKDYMALNEELTPSAGELAFYFYGDVALRRLPELASTLPEGSMQRRLLDEVARRSYTGEDTTEWLKSFARRFERLLARITRQRNAILHGATTVPAVLASIEPFVRQITGRVVAEQVHAAATGTSAVSNMEIARYGALERLARLRHGEPAHGVLFQARHGDKTDSAQ